jgi:hypothetical protein
VLVSYIVTVGTPDKTILVIMRPATPMGLDVFVELRQSIIGFVFIGEDGAAEALDVRRQPIL